jgi:peroxiredoxin Q/BCP
MKFREKYSLGFSLLSDEQKEVAGAYGVWQQKTFMGKKYMGIVRSTFIIDEQGTITHMFPRVPVKGHAEEVCSLL